ncbi:MAG TPA: hypothetical protein PLM89_12480, partial [Anaerolineales bacterium]|nr:hypothetical protein [Anaerolineales bacterium]
MSQRTKSEKPLPNAGVGVDGVGVGGVGVGGVGVGGVGVGGVGVGGVGVGGVGVKNGSAVSQLSYKMQSETSPPKP